MDNPFTAENMGEAANVWAELVMTAKRHVAEHHGSDPNDIYAKVGEAVAIAALNDPCEVHRVLFIDAAIACAVTILTDLRESNETFTSESVLNHFDSVIAAQRHMLQVLLWELDAHGTLDHLDPYSIGEVQGNA